MQFSALQLAWMHELGIDKPWIPGGSSPAVIKTAAKSAAGHAPSRTQSNTQSHTQSNTPSTAAIHASRPSADDESQTQAPQAVAHSSGAGSFVQAGELASARMGTARTRADSSQRPPSSQRLSAGAYSGVKKPVEVSAEPPLDTVTAAAQAATLEALAATVSQCNACSLCKERAQVVMGQGVMQPAIMVIGEAPGDPEDRQGLPFVGTTGILLDNMLSAIGSSRATDVYMTNSVKCRPPSNRNPRPAEIAACRPFLMRQIELVRPFSILALGRFAAQTLLGGEAQLAEMRDKPFSINHAGLDIPVVVSFHPGHLLHHPSDKAHSWRDLQRARVISKGL